MAINRTDLKRAVHSSMSRGSPHQWNQSPYQRNYSKWWIHSSSSNVSLGHLANYKELGKTERTHWEGKFGPKLWSSHLWSGGHLFKMLVKWLSKWAEADWAWSITFSALSQLPWGSFPHPLLLKCFTTFRGPWGYVDLLYAIPTPSIYLISEGLWIRCTALKFSNWSISIHCHLLLHIDKETNAKTKSTSE